MAVSLAKITGADTTWGNKRVKVRNVTFDDSYPTGGESITPSDVGLRKIDYAIATVKAVSGTVNVAQLHYDTANSKLIAYDETPGEVANEADLTDVVAQVVFVGH